MVQGEKTVGVLGGMGPEATVDFCDKIVQLCDATEDQDHLHLIIDHNPKVPNRHKAIVGEGLSPGPVLGQMARTLQNAGADFIVMPCNTAHAFAEDIRSAITIPFVDLIRETVEDIRARTGVKRVGVMAAQGCLDANLYQSALSGTGFTPVTWGPDRAAEFMNILYRIKAAEKEMALKSELLALADDLTGRGADVLIAACTEVPLILSGNDFDVPFVSTTDLLAKRTIQYARNQIPLPDLY